MKPECGGPGPICLQTHCSPFSVLLTWGGRGWPLGYVSWGSLASAWRQPVGDFGYWRRVGGRENLGHFFPTSLYLERCFCFLPPCPPMAASPLQFQLLPYDPGSWAMVIPLPPSVFLDLGTIVAFCYGQSGWSCHPLLASDLHPTYNQFPELPFI